MMIDYDKRQLPAVKSSDRMTEQEARLVGISANRLDNLRHAIGSNPSGAGMAISCPSKATIALSLDRDATLAVLSLLAEREVVFLTSFDIEVSPTL
jgi:hypothetical protein